jgi:hypothetical protein
VCCEEFTVRRGCPKRIGTLTERGFGTHSVVHKCWLIYCGWDNLLRCACEDLLSADIEEAYYHYFQGRIYSVYFPEKSADFYHTIRRHITAIFFIKLHFISIDFSLRNHVFCLLVSHLGNLHYKSKCICVCVFMCSYIYIYIYILLGLPSYIYIYCVCVCVFVLLACMSACDSHDSLIRKHS